MRKKFGDEYQKYLSDKYGETPPLERRNFNSKEKFMSDELERESKTTDLMKNIAWDIVSLKSHSMTKIQLAWKNAQYKSSFDAINQYRSTFGDDGLAYLENESGKFIKKYGSEKPDITGLQEIEKFTDKLDTLLYLKQNLHLPDRKAHYNSFIASEEKEIAAFMNRSSLEKINNHIEKNSTIEPNSAIRVKGFMELARDLNKGKIYPGDIMAFTLRNNRFPTDEEIKNFPKQGETPPLERRNFNSKEKFMSENTNTKEMTVRPSLNAAAKIAKEEAFINALHQRKMVLETLTTGTLSCLPDQNGFADTEPVVNVVSGDFYHGINLLDLKDHQKQNGFPTAEYITENMVNKAQEKYPDLNILKDQKAKGIFIHWEEKNEETDEWDKKSVKLYNIAQTTNPQQVKEWAEQKQQEKYQEYVEYKQKDNPGWTPPEPKQKNPGPIVECTSSEPGKYLGQYLAAVSMGGKFKVTPEQAAEFQQKMQDSLTELKENGYPDPFKLSKIGNEANKYCKEVKRETSMILQKEQYKEQKQEQEQTQSRGGRGM